MYKGVPTGTNPLKNRLKLFTTRDKNIDKKHVKTTQIKNTQKNKGL